MMVMSTDQPVPFTQETSAGDISTYVDDPLIEKIRCDLDKQITREHIREVALEVAAEFQEAKIKTFVPIFIHRLTLERLNHQ